MTRLIDADGLVNDLESYDRVLCDDYHMKDYVFDQIITDIKNQPTVDAVPVEFIEKEINMTKKGGADMYPHCLTVMLNRWKRAERREDDTVNRC